LRKERFDRAILLQNAFDAALLAWMARIPARIGYARDGRGALLTQPIETPAPGDIPEHQRFYYLELLRLAGWIEQLPECADIRLSGVEELRLAGRAEQRRRRLPAGRWIGVSPGAAYGGAKRWIPERFAEAASKLSAHYDAYVALFGSAAEADVCAEIANRIGPRAYSMAGQTTLAQYIDLAADCFLYLTNDSGPMHVACALGVPTVAIFGATDHIATGPSAAWAKVLRRDVECSPCLLRECPIDHRCMTAVTAQMAVDEALALLERLERAE
jgi:heptosyltransferase-2